MLSVGSWRTSFPWSLDYPKDGEGRFMSQLFLSSPSSPQKLSCIKPSGRGEKSLLDPASYRNSAVRLEPGLKAHLVVDLADDAVAQTEELTGNLALAGAVARRAVADSADLAHDPGKDGVRPGGGGIVE